MPSGQFTSADIEPTGGFRQLDIDPKLTLGQMMQAGMSNAEQFKNGDPSNPWDAGAMRIGNAVAQSRFTRAPITIENLDVQLGKLNTQLTRLGIKNVTDPHKGETEVSGRYKHATGEIGIYPKGKPTYADLSNTILHEDIHALLNTNDEKWKVPYNELPQTSWSKWLFSQPGRRAFDGFSAGHRAGSANDELPAYVGAYKEGQLPHFTEDDRQEWLKLFVPQLKPETKMTLERMMRAGEAAATK